MPENQEIVQFIGGIYIFSAIFQVIILIYLIVSIAQRKRIIPNAIFLFGICLKLLLYLLLCLWPHMFSSAEPFLDPLSWFCFMLAIFFYGSSHCSRHDDSVNT